ncbi:MAG: gamma-glutamyl-gamma-aminobutyrate hydrolase family protein [Candidatus Saccharimonas sp.]
MRILLVDNDTDSWDKLLAMVSTPGNEVTTLNHRELHTHDTTGYDLIVLSGGWWYDDFDELRQIYAGELQLIRTSTIPIIGICIGMQLMHVALEGDVPLLDARQDGFQPISLTPTAQKLFELPAIIEVFKYHTRGVLTPDDEFELLATSPGHIEIMRHRTRPLLGVQFHPESEPTVERSRELFARLIRPLVGITDDGE